MFTRSSGQLIFTPESDAPQPATTPFPPPQVVPPPPSTSVPAVSSSKASPPPPPPPPPPASVGRPKLKKQRRLSPPTEIPYGALNALQYHVPPQVQITASRDLDSIMLCAHDLMLPDFPTLHTRMLLGAWESGLDGVSEESAKLLLLSLQVRCVYAPDTCIVHTLNSKLWYFAVYKLNIYMSCTVRESLLQCIYHFYANKTGA